MGQLEDIERRDSPKRRFSTDRFKRRKGQNRGEDIRRYFGTYN